jgi:hypothetical protein
MIDLRAKAAQENNRSRRRASQSRDAAAILTLRFAAACSLVSLEMFRSIEARGRATIRTGTPVEPRS